MWWWIHPAFSTSITTTVSVHGVAFGAGLPALGRNVEVVGWGGAVTVSPSVTVELWLVVHATALGVAEAVAPTMTLVPGIGVLASAYGSAGGSVVCLLIPEIVVSATAKGGGWGSHSVVAGCAIDMAGGSGVAVSGATMFERGFGVAIESHGVASGYLGARRGVRTRIGPGYGASSGSSPDAIYGVNVKVSADGGSVAMAGLSAGRIIDPGTVGVAGVASSGMSRGALMDGSARGAGWSSVGEVIVGLGVAVSGCASGWMSGSGGMRGITAALSAGHASVLGTVAAEMAIPVAIGAMLAAGVTGSEVAVGANILAGAAHASSEIHTVEAVRGAIADVSALACGLGIGSATVVPAAGTATIRLAGDVTTGIPVRGECRGVVVAGGIVQASACLCGEIDIR